MTDQERIAELETRLAASEARECRMRGVIDALCQDGEITEDARRQLLAPLVGSGPCPHEAKAEARLKQFVTQVSMDHAAICKLTGEVERLRKLCGEAAEGLVHFEDYPEDEAFVAELEAAAEGREG